MQSRPVISSRQLVFMALGSAMVFPYTFMPILDTPPANQDAWIVLLLSIPYVVVINAPALFMASRFRGMTLSQMTESVLGRFAGKAAGMAVVLFCFFCYSACMLITQMFISLYIFPETPPWAIMIFMVAPVCYASCKGADIIGGLAIVFVIIILISTVIYFLLGFDMMKPDLLKPILADSEFMRLNMGAFLTASRYSEILIVLVFSFYLGKQYSIVKTYAAALAIFLPVFLLILFPVLLTFGSELARHIWNPYYVYTRHMEAYDFLRRLQSINALAWFPVSLLKLTMYNYMGSHVLSGIFGTKSHKPFVIPLALAGYFAVLIPAVNNSATVDLLRSDDIFPYIVLPVTFVIPLLVTLVYFFRRKKVDAAVAKMKREGAFD